MKTFTLVIAMGLCFSAAAKHQNLSLQQALDRKLVMAKAFSKGNFQGYCINLMVKNLSPDSLIIEIEAGRRLNSAEEKFQDILVTKTEIIALSKLQIKNIAVKGYCCQADHGCPKQNAIYDINKLADSSLLILARYLNANNFPEGAEQSAIWAISNNKGTANINAGNDSSIKPLRKFVSILKNEPEPWYTITTKTIMYASGNMQTYNIALKGQLNYSNDKETYTTLHVLNEKGLEVAKIVKQWTLVGNGQTYDLDIPVSNLAKGTYKIELTDGERQLAMREFKI
jgi:hypothetical protein